MKQQKKSSNKTNKQKKSNESSKVQQNNTPSGSTNKNRPVFPIFKNPRKIITELKWKCDSCQRKFYAESNYRAHSLSCRRNANDQDANDQDEENIDEIPELDEGNDNIEAQVPQVCVKIQLKIISIL